MNGDSDLTDSEREISDLLIGMHATMFAAIAKALYEEMPDTSERSRLVRASRTHLEIQLVGFPEVYQSAVMEQFDSFAYFVLHGVE